MSNITLIEFAKRQNYHQRPLQEPKIQKLYQVGRTAPDGNVYTIPSEFISTHDSQRYSTPHKKVAPALIPKQSPQGYKLSMDAYEFNKK